MITKAGEWDVWLSNNLVLWSWYLPIHVVFSLACMFKYQSLCRTVWMVISIGKYSKSNMVAFCMKYIITWFDPLLIQIKKLLTNFLYKSNAMHFWYNIKNLIHNFLYIFKGSQLDDILPLVIVYCYIEFKFCNFKMKKKNKNKMCTIRIIKK